MPGWQLWAAICHTRTRRWHHHTSTKDKPLPKTVSVGMVMVALPKSHKGHRGLPRIFITVLVVSWSPLLCSPLLSTCCMNWSMYISTVTMRPRLHSLGQGCGCVQKTNKQAGWWNPDCQYDKWKHMMEHPTGFLHLLKRLTGQHSPYISRQPDKTKAKHEGWRRI